MPQKYLALIVLVTVLPLVVAPVHVALAQGDGFTETFDDPTLPNWEKSREAIVTNGVLQMSPGSFALHFGDWSEITLTVKVKYSGEGEATINYYFREGGKYGLFLSTGRVRLEKELDQSPTMLAEAEVAALQPDEWLDIEVVVSGGDHQVSVGEEQVLTANDPEPLETGAVMFQAMGEMTVEFDDLDVRGTPGEGPPPGEPAPPEGGPPPGEAPPQEGEIAAAPLQAGPTATPVASSGAQGGVGGLIEEFFASQASPLELSTFLINLLLAALCAYVLSLVYIHWGTSLTNRRKFAANFMLMTITTTFIILVVRSSVALSLGLVGALSIVRFRTAVKETEELAFLFVAIGIGIGLGDNQRLITLLALATVIAIIGLRRIFRRPDADVNLHLTVASHNSPKIELEQIMAALRPTVAKMKLLRFDETAESMEAAFLIEFGRMDGLTEAKSALRALSGSLEISFMDNKGLW